MKEIWKDILGYEGFYKVSNFGRIKSLKRKVNTNDGYTANYKERIMKPCILSKGYLGIRIHKNCKGESKKIHRLVLETFIGKSELQVNHKNGIKSDNCLKNLEYCTNKENCGHASKIGLFENHRKLNDSQVYRIKFIAKNYKVEKGYWSKLAKSLNISPTTISEIKNNRKWNQVIV